MGAELVSVSSDTAWVLDDGVLSVFEDLEPDQAHTLSGLEVTTLPRPGERLSTFATANDVHFGETVCGLLHESDVGPTFSSPPGAEPYPTMMSRLATEEIAALDPDAVVVKGDLTADGRDEEYAAFLACWQGAFGERLTHVRGNHDAYHGQSYADWPFQEIVLPGVTIALLDTTRPRFTNGDLSAEQLEALDELGARAQGPVMVLGHHPIWEAGNQARSDDVFGLLPDATDALRAVFERRRSLVAYAAGHTHRTSVSVLDGVPYIEIAALKDFPGAWAEYQVFDGGILQITHRVGDPLAIDWTEQTRGMFAGTYGDYAYGAIGDRCRLIPVDRRAIGRVRLSG